MSQSLLQRVQHVRATFPKLCELCASITLASEKQHIIEPDDVIEVVSGNVVMEGDLLFRHESRNDEARATRQSGQPQTLDLTLRQRLSADEVHDSGAHRAVRAMHHGVVEVRPQARRLVLWVTDAPSTSYTAFDRPSWKEGGRFSIVTGDLIDSKLLTKLREECCKDRADVSIAYIAGARIGTCADGEIMSFPQNGKLQLQFVGEPGKITLRSWKACASEHGAADLTRQPSDVAMQVIETCATSGPHSRRQALNEFFGALFFLSDPSTLLALPRKLHGTEALMKLLRIPQNGASLFFDESTLVQQFPNAFAFFTELAGRAWDKMNKEESATSTIGEALSDAARQEILTVLAVPSLRGTCEVAKRVLLSYQLPGRITVHRRTNQAGYHALILS